MELSQRGPRWAPLGQRKRTMNQARKERGERGTSTLEFLVVLPVLLCILLLIMELSLAWLTVNIVTTASREAARVGSVTPTLGGDVFDPSAAVQRIDDILGGLSVGATRSVTCPTPCVTGSDVTANVQVIFSIDIPIFWRLVEDWNINKTTVMRYE